MTPETRALIEILRYETQSREVFDRCNAVLAGNLPNFFRKPNAEEMAWAKAEAKRLGLDEIHADEAEVEIITGAKR